MIPVPFSQRQLASFRRVYPDAHLRHLDNAMLLVWTTHKGKRVRALVVHVAEESEKEGTVRIRKSDLRLTTTHKRAYLAS